MQILSENLIPFVAIDTGTDCVAAGKAQDLPVYYGDAGSPAVLHLLGWWCWGGCLRAGASRALLQGGMQCSTYFARRIFLWWSDSDQPVNQFGTVHVVLATDYLRV